MSQSPPKARTLTPAEIEEAYRIWSLSFESGSRNMDHWRRGGEALPAGSITTGIYEREKLQAVLGIINFHSYFGPDTILPMGGIAAVASLPASRGRGYAGACLAYALAQMREAGQVVSALYPFNWEFYQKYGWDWVGLARVYTVPTANIKPFPETEAVREASENDYPAIKDAYARHARRYRGAIVRTDHQWNDMLADTSDQFTSLYLYDDGSGVEGYLTYRGGNREKLELRELVALTPAAQRGLLGLLRRQGMQFRSVSWKAPGDDPLWSQLYHWDIDTKLRPIFMGRIVDVQGALEAYPAPKGFHAVVHVSVHDEYAPWNTGTWQVTSWENKLSVERSKAKPQISLDIQALSQLYFGSLNPTQLRAGGRMEVHDEHALFMLSRFLDGPPTWENDFF